VKGSGVVFTRGEGISTPHVRRKGRQPLIECANMTLIFTFPFMSLYPLYPFYIFFSFCGRQGCFPLLLQIISYQIKGYIRDHGSIGLPLEMGSFGGFSAFDDDFLSFLFWFSAGRKSC